MLIFHGLDGKQNLCPVVYDLGVFQVRLDVLSLEKLENLEVFCLNLYLVCSLMFLVRFYNFQG